MPDELRIADDTNPAPPDGGDAGRAPYLVRVFRGFIDPFRGANSVLALLGLVIGSMVFIASVILTAFIIQSNKYAAQAQTQSVEIVTWAKAQIEDKDEQAREERRLAREERRQNWDRIRELTAEIKRAVDKLDGKVDTARKEAAATREEVKQVKKAVEAIEPQ